MSPTNSSAEFARIKCHYRHYASDALTCHPASTFAIRTLFGMAARRMVPLKAIALTVPILLAL